MSAMRCSHWMMIVLLGLCLSACFDFAQDSSNTARMNGSSPVVIDFPPQGSNIGPLLEGTNNEIRLYGHISDEFRNNTGSEGSWQIHVVAGDTTLPVLWNGDDWFVDVQLNDTPEQRVALKITEPEGDEYQVDHSFRSHAFTSRLNQVAFTGVAGRYIAYHDLTNEFFSLTSKSDEHLLYRAEEGALIWRWYVDANTQSLYWTERSENRSQLKRLNLVTSEQTTLISKDAADFFDGAQITIRADQQALVLFKDQQIRQFYFSSQELTDYKPISGLSTESPGCLNIMPYQQSVLWIEATCADEQQIWLVDTVVDPSAVEVDATATMADGVDDRNVLFSDLFNNTYQQILCDSKVSARYVWNCDLVRYRLEGNQLQRQDKKALIDTVPSFEQSLASVLQDVIAVQEDQLFLSNGHQLYRYHISTGELELAWHNRYQPFGDMAGYFSANDKNYVIAKSFIDHWWLYERVQNELKKVQKISENVAFYLNHIDGDINQQGKFYVMKSENDRCMIIEIDVLEGIVDERSSDLCHPEGDITLPGISDVRLSNDIYVVGDYAYRLVSDDTLNPLGFPFVLGAFSTIYRSPLNQQEAQWQPWQEKAAVLGASQEQLSVYNDKSLVIAEPSEIDSLLSADNSDDPQRTDITLVPWLKQLRWQLFSEKDTGFQVVKRSALLDRTILDVIADALFSDFYLPLSVLNFSDLSTESASPSPSLISQRTGNVYGLSEMRQSSLWFGDSDAGLFLYDSSNDRYAMLPSN
ncbi:hypothetical protein [Bacterioplanoides sp.]|uniref:hypothetical protein n=1 Tax=Bacterioplanoides sp. TaxID=2066072 RepID=UPI003AFFE3FB